MYVKKFTFSAKMRVRTELAKSARFSGPKSPVIKHGLVCSKDPNPRILCT